MKVPLYHNNVTACIHFISFYFVCESKMDIIVKLCVHTYCFKSRESTLDITN